MSEPIKAGDNCLVIGGLGKTKSPNVGLIVKVISRQFGALGDDHSKFGPVYRCSGEGVTQLADSGAYLVVGWADFPKDWLQKIKPSPAPAQTKTINNYVIQTTSTNWT